MKMYTNSDQTDRVEELMQLLAEISPMPDDETLTQESLEKYRKIVDELYTLSDPRSIVPLIQSFGYGYGLEVYWTTLHALEKFDPDILFPLLREAVQRGERGSRMWGAYMLGRHRRTEDVPILIAALRDSEYLVRENALVALGMIGDPSARPVIEELLNDPVEEVRKVAKESLEQIEEAT
jgi:HEAT repeat protein